MIKWRKGKVKPGKKSVDKLYKVFKLRNWGSEGFGKEAFIAQYTIAYDSVRHMYRDIIDTGDNLSVSNAVHSVCVKIAETITKRSEELNLAPIIHIHSIYGSPDYGEILNVTGVDKFGEYSNKTVDICVKIGEVNGLTEMAYIMECVNASGIVEDRRAGLINDFAISKLTHMATKFLKRK